MWVLREVFFSVTGTLAKLEDIFFLLEKSAYPAEFSQGHQF